ncbi:MAG: hypothetical protein PHC61_06890 [Chitinivibrionales bacterium]|nr:hypothetical protein [Chitinivibrionales bacterium]
MIKNMILLKVLKFFLFFPLALFVFSCSSPVKFPVNDFSNPQAVNLPPWECHQIYAVTYDSLLGKSCLEVAAYPQKKFPGITLDWLSGNWSGYRRLAVTARVMGHDSVPFYISVWDGRGEYIGKNRFQKSFYLTSGWTQCDIALDPELILRNKKKMDWHHVRMAVFFTDKHFDPTVFRIEKIGLY